MLRPLYSRGYNHGIHWIEGWVGTTDGLESGGTRKISFLCRESKVDSSVVQSVGRYTDWAIPAPVLVLWPNANPHPRFISLKDVFLMKLSNIYSRQHKRTQNKHTNAKPGIITNVQLTATHLLFNVKIIHDQRYCECVNQLAEICFQMSKLHLRQYLYAL
jgi:hypothetical protein